MFENTETNKLKNIDSDQNIGNLYHLFSHNVLNLDSKESLINYLNYLKDNEPLQLVIAVTIDSASVILTKEDWLIPIHHKYQLPIEYKQEPWRCHRLVLSIFDEQPKTTEELKDLIGVWQVSDPMYL